MNKKSIIHAFKLDIKHSNTVTFPICVDSFSNQWRYEFGSLDTIPAEIDAIIANKALELGLLDDF